MQPAVPKRTWTAWPLLLLVLLLVVGTFAVLRRSPESAGIGAYPIGLVPAIALACPRRFRYPALLVGVVAVWLTDVLGGVSSLRGVAFAIVAGLAGAVCVAVLTAGRRSPKLMDDTDLGRFLAAIVSSALVAAVGNGLVTLDTGAKSAGAVAIAALMSVIGSSALYLPYVMRKPERRPHTRNTERVVCWVVLLTISIFVFLPIVAPLQQLPYLVLPALGWSAVRLGFRDALGQATAVIILATIGNTLGHGMTWMQPAGFQLPAELRSIYLEIFLVVCLLITLALALIFESRLELSSRLTNEREQLRSLSRGATGLGIVGVDADGICTLFNPGAEVLTGRRADEVLGRSPAFVHQRAEVRRHATALGIALPAGATGEDEFNLVVVTMAMMPEPRAFDWELISADGTRRVVSMTITAVRDRTGEPIGYLSTTEDITERAAAQQATELALEAEQKAVEQLRELDRAKDSFVSTVSHELRTPITNIIAYLELLADGELGDLSTPQSEALSRIELNSNRLLSLINDLLTLSRVAATGLEIARRPVQLHRLFRTAQALLGPRILAAGLTFDVALPPQQITVNGDAEKLERVLVNLLTNAVKFTPTGGQVGLSLDVAGDWAEIVVSDTGVGIPIEEQKQLFTQFFRSSLARQHHIQGTGLGLSIVHTIVDLHGGQVSVTSTPGLGSTFTVRLPLADAAADVAKIPRRRPSHPQEIRDEQVS